MRSRSTPSRSVRLALLWTALLVALLFAPSAWIVSPPHGLAFAGHLVLFGVSGFLWARALPRRRALVWTVLVAAAVGSEWVQATPWIGRGAEPMDLAADGLGLALAWLAVRVSARPTVG